MNLEVIQPFLKIVAHLSPRSFINSNFELIVEPRNNIFFQLKDVETELDLKRKILSWLSRPSCKGVSAYWQTRISAMINTYLGTNFSYDDMNEIYTYLGNDCNRPLCIQFIESGYDMTLLGRPKGYDSTESA